MKKSIFLLFFLFLFLVNAFEGYGEHTLEIKEKVSIGEYYYYLSDIASQKVMLRVYGVSGLAEPMLIIEKGSPKTSFNAVIELKEVKGNKATMVFKEIPKKEPLKIVKEFFSEISGNIIGITRSWIVSNNKSTASITVYNSGGKKVCKVIVREWLPQEAFSEEDVKKNFSSIPELISSSINDSGAIAEWLLQEIEPREKKIITYSIEQELPKEVIEKIPQTQITSLGCEEISIVKQETPKSGAGELSGIFLAIGSILAILLLFFLVKKIIFVEKDQEE